MPVAGGLSQVPQYADATVSLDKGVVMCSTADEPALHAFRYIPLQQHQAKAKLSVLGQIPVFT